MFRKRMSGRSLRLLAVAALAAITVGSLAGAGEAKPTRAATYRCPAFVKWEDYGGSRWNAYIDFRASDVCNGRHVKRAYVHIVRTCPPAYDSGRVYTATASSPYDTRLYSVTKSAWDSPLWWCNTNIYYDWEYF